MSIAWRSRPDLIIIPPQPGERRVWGVKDPVTLKYYEQHEEEYFVMSHLGCCGSIEELCDAFSARFRPQTLAPLELQQFVAQLIRQGLLVSQQPGYGRFLETQAAAAEQRQRWLGLTNLLAIRFRGFDPDKMLGVVIRYCRWVFSPVMLVLCGVLIGSAILLVITQLNHLTARLPEARAWLTAQNLFVMVSVLAVTKVLHELGHALACKRFGGECHEMGFMLLVFTPCLYCNVSDVWTLKNKWQRMAVSGAGIAVEATIAALCTFLWWFSEPGLFHSMCLNLMIVCGISTLVFNGNPLLRYDGYFLMSDWLEIPNLQQRGFETVQGRLAQWYFGVPYQTSLICTVQQEALLFAYGIASAAYRIFLTFSILWVLNGWLEPQGLGPVVHAFAVVTVGLMCLAPILGLLRWVKSPGRREEIVWKPFWFKAGLTALALAALLFTPIPTRVTTLAMVQADDVAHVYVTAEGTLVHSVRPGTRVSKDDELARLVEPKLERELARLEGQVKEHRVRLDQLEKRRVQDPGIAIQIPTAKEALLDAEQQLARRKEDARRLILTAPRAGVVIDPPHQNRSQHGSLNGWSGSPLDERNQGCYLNAGTTVCLVAEPTELSATLVINQDQIPLIRAGQSVRLRWDESPGNVQYGTITEVADLDIDLLTADLIRRIRLPTRFTASGQIKPVGTWYHARIRLDPSSDDLLPGTVGAAKVIVDPQSLFTQFRRWFGRTFAFRFQA